MDSNIQQIAKVNLKDLFFVILKKLVFVILIGLVFAGALFWYKYNSTAKDVNVLDISKKLEGESDAAYEERKLNANRAKDIINSEYAIDYQIGKQRDYVANSLYMQIDPMNEAVTTAQLVIEISDNTTSGINSALALSYVQYLKSGEYLIDLSEELGTEQAYIKELVSVYYNDSTSVVINSDDDSGSISTVAITVVGPTTEYTDEIMDCIIQEVDVAHLMLSDSMCSHNVSIVGRQSFNMVDNTTKEYQYNAYNRFETLQKQIGLYDESLDDIASKLGVSKDSFYAYYSFNDESWVNTNAPMKAGTKYSVVGFALGCFVVLLIIVANYMFSKRFATQAKFYTRFPLVKKVGVAKPVYRRSPINKLIDQITGDDNKLTDEDNNKLMAANIRNLTLGMDKVLFTGTAELSKIKMLVEKLGIKADVKASFFADPECLATISDYDGVIIVEQRNRSECNLIVEELKLIANTNTKLIGAIII